MNSVAPKEMINADAMPVSGLATRPHRILYFNHTAVLARAIVIAILVQLIGGNIFMNVPGAMFGAFAGLSVSAQKHHSDRMIACGGDAWA
jgi:hypothetical protein